MAGAGIGTERRLRGTGAFVFTNGDELPIGSFRIEQHTSGRTFLYCERSILVALSAASGGLARFQGHTTAGQPIQTHGGLGEYIDTPKELCFILRNVEVGQIMPDGHTHYLSLTNLRFPTDNPRPITLTVPWGSNAVSARLSPRRNYQARIRQLTKARGIMPTATLQFNEAGLADNALGEFITDLCHALSVVQGRKINWIYHATYGPRRTFQHGVFGQTITKADTAQPLCFVPATRTAVTVALTAAKEAVPAIKHFRETFDSHNRIINAWLDARTETDYLEARTLKYVVVIEALNTVTTHADKTLATTVHDPGAWKRLYQNVIPVLSAEAANWLTLSNWQRLNIRSFRDTLAAVCNLHGITLPTEDVALFSRIRNAIVHRFDYDHTIPLPSQWGMSHHPQAAVHFFTAAFVDRIILHPFGLRTHFQAADKI
jgi:hypothetical protein